MSEEKQSLISIYQYLMRFSHCEIAGRNGHIDSNTLKIFKVSVHNCFYSFFLQYMFRTLSNVSAMPKDLKVFLSLIIIDIFSYLTFRAPKLDFCFHYNSKHYTHLKPKQSFITNICSIIKLPVSSFWLT